MCRWFLKDKIKILKSFCSNLIKIKAFLLVLNQHVCVTLLVYATEYMGSDWPGLGICSFSQNWLRLDSRKKIVYTCFKKMRQIHSPAKKTYRHQYLLTSLGLGIQKGKIHWEDNQCCRSGRIRIQKKTSRIRIREVKKPRKCTSSIGEYRTGRSKVTILL